jgi:hypothetical protein
MARHPARLLTSLLLALGLVAGAHAQVRRDQTVLPVVDHSSGKVQAYLLLEPTGEGNRGAARWRTGTRSLDATFGLEAGNSLALLCNQRSGVFSAVSSLVDNCQLASLGEADGNRRTSATAALSRPGGGFGVSLGQGNQSLPAWMTRGNGHGNPQLELNDLTVFAQKNIGDAAYVTIAGTVAKATLIPFSEAPADISDRWSSKSVSLGGGYGAFSANVIGRVIETPGQPRFEGLGLGVTWRTPWSGQLTVGAENVVTRGRNPFSPNGETADDGAVPYVRYEQDL